MAVMQSFIEIIAAWPHPSEFAADIGVTPGLVAVWKHRDSIPACYWGDVEAAAQLRGIAGVTYPVMGGIARSRRSEAAQ